MGEVDVQTGSVLLVIENDIAWITLNRPERMNAFDAEMVRELQLAIIESVDAGVIVITGAGRAFCAGGFLKELAEPTDASIRKMHYSTIRTFTEIRRSPRPVIAAVNGPAMGGGNELVIACDLAIAADSAIFGQTGPRVGSAAIGGATNLLSISIGEKRAKEVSFMCRKYSSREALEIGWINAVVDDSQLRTEVTKWATELLALSPRFLAISKANSNIWWDACVHSMYMGLEAVMQTVGSDDMKEGATAFLEKRAPRFRQR